MAAVSFVAALALRLGLEAVPELSANLSLALVLFTAVCGAVFWTTGLYRGIWRYASLNDLVAIVRAVTVSLLIFLPVTFLITRLDELPRSNSWTYWSRRCRRRREQNVITGGAGFVLRMKEPRWL